MITLEAFKDIISMNFQEFIEKVGEYVTNSMLFEFDNYDFWEEKLDSYNSKLYYSETGEPIYARSVHDRGLPDISEIYEYIETKYPNIPIEIIQNFVENNVDEVYYNELEIIINDPFLKKINFGIYGKSGGWWGFPISELEISMEVGRLKRFFKEFINSDIFHEFYEYLSDANNYLDMDDYNMFDSGSFVDNFMESLNEFYTYKYKKELSEIFIDNGIIDISYESEQLIEEFTMTIDSIIDYYENDNGWGKSFVTMYDEYFKDTNKEFMSKDERERESIKNIPDLPLEQIKKRILEALPLNLAKKYVKMSKGQYKTMYDELFQGKNRIYIPLKYDTDDIEESPIEDYLKDQGYEVDYEDGYAYKNKQKMKIGKILRKQKPEWLDIYEKDPIRQRSRLMVVISRHPYDIAGMSTDRDWESCMNLYTGSNREFVQSDIEEGTIIAYLISAKDKNIEHPLARVLIKPYIQQG